MAGIARPPCDEAIIRARPCEAPARTNGPWILATAILGSSMAFIDSTVVNVALPVLQSSLRVSLADVQWVVESYALFVAALLLTGGSLGDLYGRRKIFVSGVAMFTAASVMVRAVAQCRAVDRCQGSPRHRWGSAGPRQPRSN
jgi:Major Facilitator Superfamily